MTQTEIAKEYFEKLKSKLEEENMIYKTRLSDEINSKPLEDFNVNASNILLTRIKQIEKTLDLVNDYIEEIEYNEFDEEYDCTKNCERGEECKEQMFKNN